jgi:nitrogen fixation NifU-like protein
MMAAAVKGRSVDEVNELTRAFKRLLSIRDQDDDDDGQSQLELGELEALKGVMKFPSRIKCATLAWNTLAQALDESAAAPAPGGS